MYIVTREKYIDSGITSGQSTYSISTKELLNKIDDYIICENEQEHCASHFITNRLQRYAENQSIYQDIPAKALNNVAVCQSGIDLVYAKMGENM